MLLDSREAREAIADRKHAILRWQGRRIDEAVMVNEPDHGPNLYLIEVGGGWSSLWYVASTFGGAGEALDELVDAGWGSPILLNEEDERYYRSMGGEPSTAGNACEPVCLDDVRTYRLINGRSERPGCRVEILSVPLEPTPNPKGDL